MVNVNKKTTKNGPLARVIERRAKVLSKTRTLRGFVNIACTTGVSDG